MNRQHGRTATPVQDPYAAHRCVNCPHIVYDNDVPGEACRWASMPGGGSGKTCKCVDHRLPLDGTPRTAAEVTSDAAQNAIAS